MTMLQLRVDGDPVSQGSKRIGRHGLHAVILDANDRKLRPWRDAMRVAALHAIAEKGDWTPMLGPVRVRLIFTFTRPASHWRTGINSALLTRRAREHPAVPPDIDKCARAALDSLAAAGVFRDDAQVIELQAFKKYAHRTETPGADITIREVP